MYTRIVLASTTILLSGGAGRALAQNTPPAGAHNPVSLVDERDRLRIYVPPVIPAAPAPMVPNYKVGNWKLALNDGWPENYQWVEPLPAPTQSVPLLVIFHKFGTSQLDMTVNTGFPQEIGNQGWYAVSPLAANTQHYSSMQSQAHMEAVLQDMLLRFPQIDRNRIYAVGFSMGGGAVVNYAARHLDPAKPMIAAVIAMSGTFALKDVYLTDPPTHPYLDFWFGNGTAGSADPFKLARSSVVNFDPISLQVYANEDLARNLTHIPLQILRPTDDMVPELPRESDVTAAHMLALGLVKGPNFDYQKVPFGWDVYDHRWSMLDDHWACEWLKTKTLSIPTSARTLADHDGVYFHFYVEQDVANAYTPFQWTLDAAHNALHLSATSNLKRLTVDSLGAGLNLGLPFGVDLSTSDGLGDEIVFTSVLAAPTGVTRDGNTTTSWSYNLAAHELTLSETDGLVHTWSVTP